MSKRAPKVNFAWLNQAPPPESAYAKAAVPVEYDKAWLKEVNAQRRADGLPPFRQRKRNAVDRERLRAICMIVSPMRSRRGVGRN